MFMMKREGIQITVWHRERHGMIFLMIGSAPIVEQQKWTLSHRDSQVEQGETALDRA
jgi:hypothetical protein